MTAIIICDNCKTPFFAHGIEANLPTYLHDLPLFNGVRKITSSDVKRKHSTGWKRHAVSTFVDLCDACARKEARQRK